MGHLKGEKNQTDMKVGKANATQHHQIEMWYDGWSDLIAKGFALKSMELYIATADNIFFKPIMPLL